VRAFATHRGLHRLYGFILAFSHSKFQSDQGRYWRVPTPLAPTAESRPTDVTPAEQAAELAAKGLFDIRSVFPADEDFMYLIACFGSTRTRAGEVAAALQTRSEAERRDFWKMVQAGIISQEEAERVIRFFAAGIVGENPREFQIQNAKSFSEL
jgi:hypothetical protein